MRSRTLLPMVSVINVMNVIGIEYEVHQENTGWSRTFKNGEMAGVIGQSLRVEALRARLTGPGSENYQIHVNSHIQDIGWQGFVSQGELSGTVGQSKRIEAIQCQIVANDGSTPPISIQYRTHAQDIGTASFARDGQLAGSDSGSKRVEGIQMLVTDRDVDLSQYEVPAFVHFDPVPTVPILPVVSGRLGLKYFNEDVDFLCEDGCGWDSCDEIKLMADRAREIYGHALVISSGGRCPEWNAEVGGIPNSNHVLKTACDVYAPGRMSYEEVDVLAAAMQQAGFHTISYHDELFVHGDMDKGENWSMN